LVRHVLSKNVNTRSGFMLYCNLNQTVKTGSLVAFCYGLKAPSSYFVFVVDVAECLLNLRVFIKYLYIYI